MGALCYCKRGSKEKELEFYNIEKMSNELFILLNDIRINPKKYLDDSKKNNLYDIFFNLESGNELNFPQIYIDKIKSNLFELYTQEKNNNEIEEKLKQLLNKENDINIENIKVFEIVFSNDINNESKIWEFLKQNKNNIETIFSNKFNNLMIICKPFTTIKIEFLTFFIFFKNNFFGE